MRWQWFAWLNQLRSALGYPQQRAFRPARARPRLEQLETRELLTAVSFYATAASLSEGASATLTVSRDTSVGTISVVYQTADGGAVAGTNYTATTGTLTLAPSDSTKTLTVPTLDDGVSGPDQNFQVRLSNPTGASLNTSSSTATVTLLDVDPVPNFSFTAASYTAAENAGTVSLPVTLSGTSRYTVTVNYATSDGTAKAGTNYGATSGSLVFQPGETSKTIPVSVLDDGRDSPPLFLSVNLTVGAHDVVGANTSATLQITNVDPPPQVGFTAATYTATETDVMKTITVTLSNPSNYTVTVNYTTVDGTLTAPREYGPSSGTLTFTPGNTSATFAIPLVHNQIDGPDQLPTLVLSSPVHATLDQATSQSTLHVQEVDPPPGVGLLSPVNAVLDNATQATITVTLQQSSGWTVTVAYQTSDLDATSLDYTPTSGTLTFNPGETSKTFNVPIIDDGDFIEPDESLALTLSSPTHATLGTFPSGTLTIQEELDGRGGVLFGLKDRNVSGVVATFSRGGTGQLGTTYLYAIDWGDGQIDTGQVDATTPYAYYFTVSGTHKYNQDGVYDVVTNLLGADLDGVQKSVFGLGAALVFNSQQETGFNSVQAASVSGTSTNLGQSGGANSSTFGLSASVNVLYTFSDSLTEDLGNDSLQTTGSGTLNLSAGGVCDPARTDVRLFMVTQYNASESGTELPVEVKTDDDFSLADTRTERSTETLAVVKSASFSPTGTPTGTYTTNQTRTGTFSFLELGNDLTGYEPPIPTSCSAAWMPTTCSGPSARAAAARSAATARRAAITAPAPLVWWSWTIARAPTRKPALTWD
jgi:hypothetical protein